ncbi:MAG: Processing protease [Candidatus Roizmanbacteria bacterium GW2011_GWC2_34_23]|uniref:Processing protease n=1 Tax=Candidatus Roizmanbacteria bacterium GW2011_GWC2_34_23 TaxID=1618484 RepID=A0A0G0DAE9_9BACT|nr:MAG: Processing protease [Candidatus Roizmanbacteria bacterium GW2011_GWC2_34_23]
MKPQEFTLTNGLQVIFIDTKTFPTLTTLLLVGAGSRYENERNNGIAHFFEHMAFKGSQKYPNSFVISSTVEGFGGVFNAFTSKDHTGYWIKATTEHFETMIDVISDMIQTSKLLTEEIEREKGVIREEINMYEDIPQRKVGEIFENLLYPNHPLGYDIAGTKDTVQSFNRQTFKDYIGNLYHPNNAVLVVAGGLSNQNVKSRHRDFSTATPPRGPLAIVSKSDVFDLSNYLKIIEEKFGSWKQNKKITFEKIKESQTRPQMLIKYKKTEQAHFTLGYRSFSFADDRKYALNLLATILGGGMSSRLFIQVRERRGLCYYISSGGEFYHDCGSFVTQAGVTNDLGKVKEAVKTVIDEHNKIKTGDIKKEELLKAKEMIKGRLMLSMEDSMNIASFFGTKKILQNKIMTPQEIIEKIEAITVKEITKLAKEVFIPKNLNFALIGPFAEKNFQNLL